MKSVTRILVRLNLGDGMEIQMHSTTFAIGPVWQSGRGRSNRSADYRRGPPTAEREPTCPHRVTARSRTVDCPSANRRALSRRRQGCHRIGFCSNRLIMSRERNSEPPVDITFDHKRVSEQFERRRWNPTTRVVRRSMRGGFFRRLGDAAGLVIPITHDVDDHVGIERIVRVYCRRRYCSSEGPASKPKAQFPDSQPLRNKNSPSRGSFAGRTHSDISNRPESGDAKSISVLARQRSCTKPITRVQMTRE